MSIAALLQQLDSGQDPFAPSEQQRKDALTQALITAGMAMLAGNNSSNPWPAIGMGGLAGMDARSRALGDASAQKKQAVMLRQQLAQLARQEAEYQRQDRGREAMGAARTASTIAPGMAKVAGGTGFDDEGNAMPTLDVQTPGGFDADKFSQMVMQNPDIDIEKAMALRGALAKQQGWRKVGKAPGGGDLYVGPDGKPEVIGKQGENWVPLREMDGGILMQETNSGRMDWVGMKGTRVNATAYGGAGGKVTQGLDEATGKYVMGDGGVLTQMTTARQQNQILRSMIPRVNTSGFFAPENKTFQSMLTAIGLGGDKAKLYAANAEAFQADAMQLVLNEQAKQKGPQTDKDFMRIQESLPRLRNTPLGNEFIIRLRIAQNNQLAARAEFIGRLMMNRQQPMNALEAEIAWTQSPEGSRSLFDDPILKGFSMDPRASAGSIGTGNEATVGNVTVQRVQ